MSAIGLYHPGTSVLHQCPTSAKLLGLVVCLFLTIWFPLYAVLPTLVLYAVARIPPRVALAQVRPLWLLLTMTAIFQILTASPYAALRVTTTVLVSVALAGLITLTTRVSAMLDVLARSMIPLRRLGIEPDRVALLLALTIRCVPLLTSIVGEVREAQIARGAPRNPLALAVPIVVRALRSADALGEALTARGVDD